MIRRLLKLESRRWTSQGPQDLRNKDVVSSPTTGHYRFLQSRTTKRHKKPKTIRKAAFTGQRTRKGKAQERPNGEPQWLIWDRGAGGRSNPPAAIKNRCRSWSTWRSSLIWALHPLTLHPVAEKDPGPAASVPISKSPAEESGPTPPGSPGNDPNRWHQLCHQRLNSGPRSSRRINLEDKNHNGRFLITKLSKIYIWEPAYLI